MNNNMTLYHFEKYQSDELYEDKIKEFDQLSFRIGKISMAFNFLDLELSKKIIQLSGLNSDSGNIFTAEQSFKQKVHIFSSLLKILEKKYSFNYYPGYEKTQCKELIKALFKCEQFRNQIIHSHFQRISKSPHNIERTKISAKARKGLLKTHDPIDYKHLINIENYINSINFELDHFMIDIKKIGTALRACLPANESILLILNLI